MKQNRIVELITDPTKNFLSSFVVGTLLFTVISDGLSALFWETFGDWLQTQLGIEKAILQAAITTILILLILVVIYATNFPQWLKPLIAKFPIFGIKVPDDTNVVPLTTTFPGLITAMSLREDSPAQRVIEHHWNQGQKPHLKHCWLICTNQSLPYAQKMIKKLTDTGMTQTVEFHYGNYELEDLEHPGQKLNLLVPDDVVDDPNYIRRLVNCIYADAKHQGLEESQLIADYTGATKSMTVGIVLACTAPERQLQYISQITDPQMMQVKISYKLKPLEAG
ncbi:CRISPR-associated protein [Allocoleopsis franciscana]|uniref:CRISPR-associated protein (Cas_Cas02710) n=1 Tax=Allocoleopsis franciscana PCC 7113 TaxID=1173027 RepID=K9WQW3_9CYAN|nr:CRISPR-associated protein [Allocoleopsis franciscana]AFZ22164.1 CRISPR-associated protein (Cas_Cas02710) [Allocoleopsis franciscana PCC 7113]